MDDSRTARLVETVLRCYPARWRRRHGDEAAELAALLIRDGTPAGSIAWSYLAGAAREWLTPRLGRRLSTMTCALLVAAGSLGASAGLLASAAPARAASTSQARTNTSPVQASSSQASASRSQVHASASEAHASTSQAPARAHCPPSTSEPSADVLPAMGHPRVIIGEAGHGRSC
jgi:hypothetical protein